MVQKRAFLALILAIFLLPLSSSSDLIDDTCKKTPNYSVCASILKGDPKSSGADVRGLALIMVDSLKSKSNSALTAIGQLLKTSPGLKDPLSQCLKNYNFILQYGVSEAVEALTKGDPKFAEDATRNSGSVAKECEDGFKSSSPISGINKDAQDIADVATSIIRMLL